MELHERTYLNLKNSKFVGLKAFRFHSIRPLLLVSEFNSNSTIVNFIMIGAILSQNFVMRFTNQWKDQFYGQWSSNNEHPWGWLQINVRWNTRVYTIHTTVDNLQLENWERDPHHMYTVNF